MLRFALSKKFIQQTFTLTKTNLANTTATIMSTPSKVAKLSPFIGTHDSTFHCDDVTACQMLKSLPRFKDHDIVRTRDQDLLDRAEIVVDVGSVFDADKLRLDHHQRSFNLTIKDFYPKLKTTNPDKPPRLSSAGLVYSIFGKDYICQALDLGLYKDLTEDKKLMVDALFEKAYVEFFEEIDAIDNGVNIAVGDNIVYNYHINSGISSRVGRLNPTDANASPDQRLQHFKKAMKLVGDELAEGISFLGMIWWPQRQRFKELILKRKEFDPSGQIIFIENDHLVGWKSAVFDFEEELGLVGDIKFITFHNETAEESPWRATAVPVEPKSFECRVPFPAEWRGKRGEELQKDSGIADASFVHYNGFTGGAQSREGIMAMLRKTLKLEA